MAVLAASPARDSVSPARSQQCKYKEASPRRFFFSISLISSGFNQFKRCHQVEIRWEARQHLRIKNQDGFISPKANISTFLRGGADFSFPAFLKRCSFLLTEHKCLELTQPGSISWPPANQGLNSPGMITLQRCQSFRVCSFPTGQCSSSSFSSWDFQFSPHGCILQTSAEAVGRCRASRGSLCAGLSLWSLEGDGEAPEAKACCRWLLWRNLLEQVESMRRESRTRAQCLPAHLRGHECEGGEL